MFKQFLFIFALCIFSLPSFAEETVLSGEEILLIENDNADVSVMSDTDLPSCSDSHMIDKVLSKITTYFDNNQAMSIKDKRKQIVFLKNLSSFEEVQIKNFVPQKDYNVANKIIMSKINNNLGNDDMRLCKSSGSASSENIYLLMYPKYGIVYIDIINFASDKKETEDFYVTYP